MIPKDVSMSSDPHVQLVTYKQWADRGLCNVVASNLNRINTQDATLLLRILDHIHVVDRVFQHHLQGVPHQFRAPRSQNVPDLQTLASGVGEVDEWYVTYVGESSEQGFGQPVDFFFTNGNPARMTRGEILLHVCMHGTYHRGNAGVLLQNNGVAPNDDRMTDFLDAAGSSVCR
jgi:uncharacterized damage-inducible protein DinB